LPAIVILLALSCFCLNLAGRAARREAALSRAAQDKGIARFGAMRPFCSRPHLEHGLAKVCAHSQ